MGEILCNFSVVCLNAPKINQAHGIIERISEEIQLTLAPEFVNQEIGEIAFFWITHCRFNRHSSNRRVDVRCDVVVKLFVLPGKPTRLLNAIAHSGRTLLRGTNGVACARGSANDANDSATKLTGNSGLSSAARPTFAQNSTCPAIVLCSVRASARAWS